MSHVYDPVTGRHFGIIIGACFYENGKLTGTVHDGHVVNLLGIYRFSLKQFSWRD